MSWMGLVGHDEQVERFRQRIAAERLSSTFLFTGPPGIGKGRFALQLAQCLLCQQHAEVELMACGTCPACTQVVHDTHPDVDRIERPVDRSFIPLELLIGDREHRMRAGLCHRVSMTPMSGRRKIAIIDDADYLNAEGANCLLKLLEEPPAGSVLILIGSSPQRQLPTVRSRSQIIRFQPLATELLAQLLVERGACDDPAAARRLAQMADGSVARALQLADPQVVAFRSELWPRLAASQVDWNALAARVTAVTDEAGKEAPRRRQRLHVVASLLVEFYRERMRAEAGMVDHPARQAAPAAAEVAGDGQQVEATATRLQRCLDAMQQIDANAHLPTLIDCWIDDLRLANAGPAP